MSSYEIQDMPDFINPSELYYAIDYSMNFLGVQGHVEIIFEEFDELGVAGNADVSEDGDLEITVNSALCVWQILSTVVHEMVHIRQFERGELQYTANRETPLWNGVDYHCGRDVTDVAVYKSLPWEEEAYRLEEQMMFTILLNTM